MTDGAAKGRGDAVIGDINRAARALRMPSQKKEASSAKRAAAGAVAREYTINLHRRLHKIAFKHKAPRALKEVKHFAATTMGTRDVRVDARLNKFLWSKGIRNVPFRVRVRLTRKRSEDAEGNKGAMYTLVTYVPVEGFKGLQTTNVSLSD
eukprot:m51a1_g5367 putative 60S ribosomal protein L31e (151) ;mRNA; f:520442-521027